MGNMIFMAIALIILMPIFYFLPLGFSRRGKGLIILASFSIALLGIIAVSSFSLWQTILIIVLAVVLVGLLFVKRLDGLLLEMIEEQNLVQNDHDELQHKLDHFSDTYKHIAFFDKHTKISETADDSLPTGWTREKIPFEQNEKETPYVQEKNDDDIGFDRSEWESGFENDLTEHEIEPIAEDADHLPEIEDYLAVNEEERTGWNHSSVNELEEIFYESSEPIETENEIIERASFDGWDEEELPVIVFEEQNEKEPEKV